MMMMMMMMMIVILSNMSSGCSINPNAFDNNAIDSATRYTDLSTCW